MTHPITNFGGNVHFTPRHFYQPRTEEELLAILDRHAQGKIRVMGALHSWSPAVQCDDVAIDLRHFDSVELQRDADGTAWATVGGGCRIKHLLAKLHALGDVTMPTLGLITEQTIAGAIATATHGSGRHSLSHYIDELRVAAYDPTTGKARIYDWNADSPHPQPLSHGARGVVLQAARCAVGCMGVVLSVRFRCVPRYEVSETIEACATIDDVLAGEADYPFQQFYFVPHLWRYFAQRRRVIAEYRPRRSFGARLYRVWWFLAIDVGLHAVIKTLVSILRSPKLTRFFFRHVLSPLILKNVTVSDHSDRMLIMEHELFKHLEIEIFVPAHHLRDAAAFVQYVVQIFDGATSPRAPDSASMLAECGLQDELARYRGSFTHHYPITFRRVLSDDALLAPSSGTGEPWYAISMITYAEPRERFFVMAGFLARSMAKLFQARLHWGKYFALDGRAVAESYPQLQVFRDLCRQVDPQGVFRNEFADQVLFAETDAVTIH